MDQPSAVQTKYRFVILLLFDLACIINFMQLLQFSIISNIVVNYYSIPSSMVDLTSMIFFISFILLFYPCSFLTEKLSLKWIVTIAMALTFLGNFLKLLSILCFTGFWLILCAQALCAFAQVQLSALPTKLATIWFGNTEMSSACAVAVLGMNLGSALGCLQSSLFVVDLTRTEEQLKIMFIVQLIVTGVILIAILLLFKSKPRMELNNTALSLSAPSVPSVNLNSNNSLQDTLLQIQNVLKNKQFWLIVASFGLSNGVWNSFGVIFNDFYLHFFPNGSTDAGIIALISIIAGGCIGSVLFGILLDKTRQFKLISCSILSLSALGYVGVAVSLLTQIRIATFLLIPIFGFFCGSVLMLGYEYIVELTYPIPEQCGTSLFNATYNLISVLAVLVIKEIISGLGYLGTFIIIATILILCAFMCSLIKLPLNRRNANAEKTPVLIN